MIESYVATRVGRVRTLQSGTAPSRRALLCWPGLGLTAGEFHRLLRDGEAMGVTVVSVDPPGHGRSDPAPQIAWTDVAAIVRDVTADFPASRFLLVGHSAGATALLFGAQGIRERVAGIVLADGGFHEGAVTGEDADLLRENEEWFREMTFANWDACLRATRSELKAWDADIEAGVRDFYSSTPQGAIRPRGDVVTITRWSVLLRDYRFHDVPHLDVPALALWAAEKQSPEPAGIATLRARLPRLRAECLLDSGHELFWDQPEAASRAVWDFFASGCN